MWCLNEAIPSDAYTKNESTGGHGGKNKHSVFELENIQRLLLLL